MFDLERDQPKEKGSNRLQCNHVLKMATEK